MTNNSFIKAAEKAADKIYNQIIEIQDEINTRTTKLDDLKKQLAQIELQIDTLKKLGA